MLPGMLGIFKGECSCSIDIGGILTKVGQANGGRPESLPGGHFAAAAFSITSATSRVFDKYTA